MIEIRYLQAESGANRFGTCNCCGKSSGEDPLMISVKFSYYGHGTLICLCDDCKKKLMEVLPPANCSETPNSSDTISRQAKYTNMGKLISESAFYEAIYKLPIREEKADGENHYYLVSIADIFEMLEKLPPAQPEIIRCKDCKYRGVGDYCVYGTRLAWVTKSNDFCSKAKRRTDG